MELKPIRSICVFCASSRQANSDYAHAADRLGGILAENQITIVYGGGAVGSMGALANGSLERGGRVVGILPKFMQQLEWGHPGITELHVVDDMHDRKRRMLQLADAVVALPGGSGTFEELLEAITWKRLGLFLKPIVIVNMREFFQPLVDQLERAVEEKFMDHRHRAIWNVVDQVDHVLDAIHQASDWDGDSQGFAVP